jgi:N utilization substance protein B
MTGDFKAKIDEMIEVAEKSLLALEIAEFTTLESQSDVKDYAVKIAQSYQKNHEEVDELIKNYSTGWDFDRLIKMDKDILRIAITELLYVKEAPMKVVVDEALELAKKYSTDDSASFINGVLAKVIVDKGIK